MELALSVGIDGRPPVDVLVRVDGAHRVRDLTSAVSRHLGLQPPTGQDRRLVRDQIMLAPELSIISADLRRGDHLQVVAPTSHQAGIAAPADFVLEISGGPDAGGRHVLPSGTTTVGRDPAADIQLRDPFVSRQHLAFDVGPQVMVRDLGSANGTRVDGQPVDAAIPIKAGQIVEVGSSQLRLVPPRVQDQPEGVPVVSAATRSADDDLPGVLDLEARLSPGELRDDWTVRIGFGPRTVTIDGHPRALADGPLPLHLDDVVEVVCAGPDPSGLARTVVAQLAAAHRSDALTIAVACGPALEHDWHWAAWLPQTSGAVVRDPAAAPRLLAFNVGEAASLLATLGRHLATAATRDPRRLVLVLDASLPWSSGDVPTPDVLRGAGAMIVWIGTPAHTADVHVVSSAEDGTVTVTTRDGQATHGNGADHLSVAAARTLALALARRESNPDDHLPRTVGLLELCPDRNPIAVRDRWTSSISMEIPVGRDQTQPVAIPLDEQGRHVAVAGARSSGRTSFLRTALAGLSLEFGPDDLGLILVSRDASAFGPLRDLPHVVAVVTDPESVSLQEALAKEVQDRQDRLESLGARSFGALRRQGASLPPRIVVILDDLLGRSLAGHASLLRDGPEVDMHLIAVLADGAARKHLPAMSNRVQLRTDDAAQSLDLLGTTAAISLPRDRVGRALVRLADGPVAAMQLACASVPSVDRDEIVVTEIEAGRPVAGHAATSLHRPASDDALVLAEIVTAATDACQGMALPDWSDWLAGQSDARERKTFMFTDIVGSTDLVGAIGDDAWTNLLRWHDDVLRSCFSQHGGVEIDNAGDGFFVAFDSPAAGMACAIDIQRRLDDHRQQAGFAPQVRIGVHETVAQRDGHRFTGHGVHEAARVGSEGGASEIVSSAATAALADASTHRPRTVMLKGVAEPVDIVSVHWRR